MCGAKFTGTMDQGRAADLRSPCPARVLSRKDIADETSSHLGVIFWPGIIWSQTPESVFFNPHPTV